MSRSFAAFNLPKAGESVPNIDVKVDASTKMEGVGDTIMPARIDGHHQSYLQEDVFGEDDEIPPLVNSSTMDENFAAPEAYEAGNDRWNEANATLATHGLQQLSHDGRLVDVIDLTVDDDNDDDTQSWRDAWNTIYDNHAEVEEEVDLLPVQPPASPALKASTTLRVNNVPKSDSDSGIVIVQPAKRLVRSSMKRNDSVTANNADEGTTDEATTGEQDTMDIDGEPQDLNSEVTIKPTTLAGQLKHNAQINIPQVLGKGAYQNPKIVDDFVVTPILKEMIADGEKPAEVLWACFLKNNIFFVDSTAACENMILWLDATPSRWKNVTSLIFDDFFNHPCATAQKKNPKVWSVYRPLRLVMKCPNLQRLKMTIYIEDLPSYGRYSGSYIGSYNPDLYPEKMREELQSKFSMNELFKRTSAKELKNVDLIIYMTHAQRKPVEDKMEHWPGQIREVFSSIMTDCGWKRNEMEKINLNVKFALI